MGPIERRQCACPFNQDGRNETINSIASASANEVFARIAAAAEKEEQDRIQTLGRRVDEIWREWRKRLLLSAGIVGLTMVSHAHGSGQIRFGEILRFILGE